METDLLAWREEFPILARSTYLISNSLGAMPRGVYDSLKSYADGWATARRTSHLEDTFTRMLEQKRAEDAVVKVQRLVTGHDLIALGLKPGPAFKTILEELENLQIEGRIKTTEEGIAYLRAAMPGLPVRADTDS